MNKMAQPAHRPDLFRWKRFPKPGAQSSSKGHLTDGDINTWIKKVQVASEFAISEVFSSQKSHTGKQSRAVVLQNMDHLQDHDDAFSEAQTILSSWMNKKLRLELEMDDEEEEEDEQQQTEEQPANLNHRNFNDMCSQLALEDEGFEVHHFLQDLMETDVMDYKTVRKLQTDEDNKKKSGHDPKVTMEIRHKQVKERRVQREATQERQRREREARREALEEARWLESQEQRRREQEAQRQEQLLQQEVVRLRREMQEKRSVEQLARKRERQKLKKPNTVESSVTPKPQAELCYREREAEVNIHVLNLQRMQKHFSAWYSVVLEKRVRLGKAAALCDWRRQLRAWRAWRALVWVRRKDREAERTEEELRLENRRCQLAEESDRRRLLRRCLSDWHLWCRIERERRQLLKRQEETRQKMAVLIDAAASGKLMTKNCTEPPITVQTETTNQSENITQLVQMSVQRVTSAPPPLNLTDRRAAPPTPAWQVTRLHTPHSLAEVRKGRRLNGAPRCRSAEICGGRFENRHVAQQKTIAEQKRLLKEQQDVIFELQERQNLLELRQETEKVDQLAIQIKASASQGVITTSHRSKEASGESSASRTDTKEYDSPLASPHPAVRAMEERARQRAARRREVEERKRRREEEKLAQMKAEEEEIRRQQEEEKRVALERRKEERKQKKEREIEKQRRTELEQKMLRQAGEHYHRSLLLHRGIIPWRRMVKQSHDNAQKAVAHHAQVLQRRCLLFWLHTTGEALAEKKSRADEQHQNILLRRALASWTKFKHLQVYLEERAMHFYTTQTQRKVFKALLDHATHERLEAWERERQADKHSARRVVSMCFAAWRRLPETLQEEREREERRERLRRKVAEILPDFRSSPPDATWSPASRV